MWSKLSHRFLTFLFYHIKERGFFAPEPDSPDEAKRILMVCIAGVGDNLLCTPVIRALRQSFPESHLAFMVHRKRKDVLKHHPLLDEIIPYHKGPLAFFKLARQLRGRRFNRVLVFHSTHGDLLPLCYLARSPHLIGFKEKSTMNYLFTEIVPHDWTIHTIQDRLRLAEKIGAQADGFKMDWQVLPAEQDAAEKIFRKHSLHARTPLIGFQLGSGSAQRRWPVEYFIELGKRIVERYGVGPLLLGSKKEEPLLNKVRSELNENAVKLIVDLRVLGALMGKLDLLVTPNTGPMHIAIAQEVPLIGIFGSLPAHIYGPLSGSPTQVVLSREGADRESNGAMKSIKPAEVFDRIEKILSLRKQPKPHPSPS